MICWFQCWSKEPKKDIYDVLVSMLKWRTQKGYSWFVGFNVEVKNPERIFMINVKHSVNKKELMYIGHVHVRIFLCNVVFTRAQFFFRKLVKTKFNYTRVYYIYVTPWLMCTCNILDVGKLPTFKKH